MEFKVRLEYLITGNTSVARLGSADVLTVLSGNGFPGERRKASLSLPGLGHGPIFREGYCFLGEAMFSEGNRLGGNG